MYNDPLSTTKLVTKQPTGVIVAKIKVENLTKIFGDRPQQGLKMLDDGKSNQEIRIAGHAVGCAEVSFEVEEGELLVVMGLSGSGKSTLIRCLNLLNSVTRGAIYVDGEDITQYNREELLDFRRKKASMVFQNFALFPYRTIIDNAAYGLEIQGVDKTERHAMAQEALELVGLKDWLHAYPNQLSGGMQQRVGLARALAVKSDILLMDEAFSALDPLIRRDMQHELVQLQQKMQKTVVFITHDLDEALQLGDRIVLMKDGRVVQFDTPEGILNNPANAYVERFVEQVDLSKVLGARAAMSRARVVAFEKDGPRTVLHKMNEENYTIISVVKRDYSFIGTLTLKDVENAVQQGLTSMENLVDTSAGISPDTPITEVLNQLIEWPYTLPVVSDDNNELLGIVTRTSVISLLADADADNQDSPIETNQEPQQ